MSTLMAREVREGFVRLRWTPEALDEMLRRGDLDADRRYEILNGELYEKMGHNWPHAFAVNALQVIFGALISQDFFVSSQLPLKVGQDLPEPDLKVIRGQLFGRRDTPTGDETLLVVEVSDSSYTIDFRVKLPIYAGAGILVYWIIDVNRRRVEVFSHPADGNYVEVKVFEGEAILPAAFEGCPSIPVCDIFVTEG
jgi:Uma2 family endonuclease